MHDKDRKNDNAGRDAGKPAEINTNPTDLVINNPAPLAGEVNTKPGNGNGALAKRGRETQTIPLSTRVKNFSREIKHYIPGQPTENSQVQGKVDPYLRSYLLSQDDSLEKSGNVKTGQRPFTKIEKGNFSETIYDDELKLLIGQIKRLYSKIAHYIPAKEGLEKIAEQRNRRMGQETGELKQPSPHPASRKEQKNDYLERLQELETLVRPNMSRSDAWEVCRKLEILRNELNVAVAQLNIEFISQINATLATPELVESDIDQIGYKDLNAMAKSHNQVISNLISQLNASELTKEGFDVLSDKAYSAISSLAEIEERNGQILNLHKRNLQVTQKMVYTVIGYIASAILLTIGVVILYNPMISTSTSLTDLKIPLIGVPGPVILWSLIGSFAAMIHRFNINPIYDFSDAIKWMLTRPVQGIVLGCAVYLILISGLFLFNGAVQNTAAGSKTSDEIILILSFFVGFSDRFADSVFNLLLRSYSPETKSKEDKSA